VAKPLCFVLMPFGQKPDGTGRQIDFDAVYELLIKPAIIAAELEPVRADEEKGGGIIHKPMFERLVMCEYAVADLTTANANVFYELGVRHATRPWTTVVVFADGTRLPFDVAPLRGLPYTLDGAGQPENPAGDVVSLTKRLQDARDRTKDSPVFQFIEGMQEQQLDHEKADLFRKQIDYSIRRKEQLTTARKQGVDAIRSVQDELGNLDDVEAGVLVDLMLSYRAVKGWDEMVELVDNMPGPLARMVIVQEQLGFALNRRGDHEKAESILLAVIEDHGPSSETFGLLGRVYKDQWDTAKKNDQGVLAKGLLDKAIKAYRRGFEADWRDAYPGINAVTLMEVRDPPDPDREGLLPVVRYSVGRRVESGQPDYWDHATQLELAILAKDENAAANHLADSVAAVREVWEPETTARNLGLIREAREERGEAVAWAKEVEDELMKRVKPQ